MNVKTIAFVSLICIGECQTICVDMQAMDLEGSRLWSWGLAMHLGRLTLRSYWSEFCQVLVVCQLLLLQNNRFTMRPILCRILRQLISILNSCWLGA